MSVLVCVFWTTGATAASLRVCASGCQFSSLQSAIDSASPGDTILLAAGQTFVGPFTLRAKPSTTGTPWITIRSDAPDTSLPADGVRLVPIGMPGGNTRRESLARLVGQAGTWITTPVLHTDPGAHHYILKFLEIDGTASLGFETIINLGEITTAALPYDLVLDRVYIHGHALKGQKRAIALNSIRTDILNSYISDIKAINADSQAIAGFNGPGPFRIVNNYLEGAGENILFGGADPAIANLVPADIQIVRNHITKPVAWRNPILSVPTSVTGGMVSGGSLPVGLHYFKVVAMMEAGGGTAFSLPSSEITVAAATPGGAALLTWRAVPGADRYRLYRGAVSNGQGSYMETATAVTTFTYTRSGEIAGTPPAEATLWTVKNLFELKNAERVRVEGNLIEHCWAAGQFGYALVLTPRNQEGGAPWVRVRDITFVNNIIRRAAGVLNVMGYDAPNVSQQTLRITVRNNLFDEIGPAWGTGAKVFLLGEGVGSVTIDRNTILHADTSVVYAYGSLQMLNFVYTNNIAEHGDYGIMGGNGRTGQYTLDKFFPGATVMYNVLAGGMASLYPAGNSFPTLTQWLASFFNPTAGDYRLLASSVFSTAGAGGTAPGADFNALYAAMGGVTGKSFSLAPQPPSGLRIK